MDQEILAFLEICRCKSISKAAEKLFISQSSLSTKIRILERNLGYSLFIRGKGSRSVMLTDKGEKFLGLAVKYQEILEKMLALGRDGGSEKLRISSMNSLGTHLLTPVYERFMAENPDIILEIKALLKNTSLNIQEIAIRTNFANQSSLGRFFRKHTGMSLSQYRMSHLD